MGKSKDERIQELEAWRKAADKVMVEQRRQTADLKKALDVAGDILVNIQPVLGRLIAATVTMERKGVFNAEELNAVENQTADDFIAAAHPEFAKKVRGQPYEAGAVESNLRVRSGNVSGLESEGRVGPGDQVSGNGKRAVISRLSDVRAAHGPSDGIDSSCPTETKDVSSGQQPEACGSGHADWAGSGDGR